MDGRERQDPREAARRWDEWSFLASPHHVCDWRLVVIWDAATSLGLIDELPGTPAQIAATLDLDPRAVRVVLEALAVWGVVKADPDGDYMQGDLVADEPEAAVLAHHARAVSRWSTDLEDRLQGMDPAASGIPTSQLAPWLEALAVNARSLAAPAVDACLAWAPATETVLDLGGGHGEYALEFARRGLKVTMQDRPEVIELARQHHALPETGVELYAGDFFETLPEDRFDLVFCAGVAYTYSGERNRELYQRLHTILAPGGGLGIVGFLRDRSPISAIFAIQMLLVSDGADTHSEADYRDWLAATGYDAVDVVDLTSRPQSLVLARHG